MKICYKYLVVLVGAVLCFSTNSSGQDGAALFKQNCTACHKLGQRLVGPDLLGINEKRSEEWLLKFIKSSRAMVDAGDPDAVAIFEEYNQTVMNDQSHLSDDDIRLVLDYIKSETAAQSGATADGEEQEPVEIIPIEYSEEDIAFGLQYFSGERRFAEGGPSCISCHHVNNDELISGGRLAKDLTNVYGRMGDAGVAGILGVPPFPAMASAYTNNALDSVEIAQLTAFLKHADSISGTQKAKSGRRIFFVGGGGGLVILFLLIGAHWRRRLRKTVKHDIYKRQIKGSDSII